MIENFDFAYLSVRYLFSSTHKNVPTVCLLQDFQIKAVTLPFGRYQTGQNE